VIWVNSPHTSFKNGENDTPQEKTTTEFLPVLFKHNKYKPRNQKDILK
jgi:hypothetical protein